MLTGKQIGPFAVEKELGSGAMGAVYLARYTKTDQLVAIKFVLSGLGHNPAMLARFEREVEILKQLKHPNIVRLYASGKYQSTPFYAMEYLEGDSLDRILQRRGKLPWEEVIHLGVQLCAALHHAHQQGIIHRDLKPSNLMITPDGTLKLTDFGIAKDMDVSKLTATNATVGTASYMSPETCQGSKNLTHSSDLYSLGVVLYELVTGKQPFVADTLLDMFLQHVQGSFERPSTIVLDVPIWLDELICELLEKKPDDRPQNAERVAERLNEIEEKVRSGQSAGLDRVQQTYGDRPKHATLPDETEKEAARALLRATRGKRKRRPKPPHKKTWFQATLLVLALAGITFLVVLGLRPPSAEKLYADAKQLMATGESEKARDGPIKQFLGRHNQRTEPWAVEMRGWADQYDCQLRERQMHARMKRDMTAEGPAETIAREAVRCEEAGDLEGAHKRWAKLEELFKSSSDREVRSWGLVAEKHDTRVRQAYDRMREFLQPLTMQPDFKPTESLLREIARAVWLDVGGNAEDARAAWAKVKQGADGKRDLASLAALADTKVKDSPPTAP